MMNGAPMKHLLSVADLGRRRHRGGAAAHRLVRRGQRRADPEGAGPAGQDRRLALLRGLDPHPAVSFETAAKRLSADTMNFCVAIVVGEEGRVAARHGRDDRGHGRRRDRRAPRLAPACPWQIADWLDGRVSVINAGDGWHEHPTQALLDCYTIRQRRGRTRRAPHRHRRRRQAQPGGPVRRPRLHRPGRRGHARRAADAAAAEPRRLAGHGQPRPRRGAAEGRRRLPAAHAARAHDRGAACRRCASTPPATASPPSALRPAARRRHRDASRAR